MLVTSLCSFLRSLEQSFCSLRECSGQTAVTCLVVQEILIRTVARLGCQSERILALCLELRIEGEEVPVTCCYCFLHLILAVVHTTLYTVQLTWSVTDDQRRSVVSLSLSDNLDSLSHVCTESDLCYIYITVAHSDLCKALLANFLTRSCELANLTDVGSLGSLTTCIGVHLGIEYHNVYVLTGSKYVIQTAESDIVCPTVTTEDPYGLLSEVIFLLNCSLCIRASGCCCLL